MVARSEKGPGRRTSNRIQMPPTKHTFSILPPVNCQSGIFELFLTLKLVTFIEILSIFYANFSKEMSDLDLCMNFIVFRIGSPTLPYTKSVLFSFLSFLPIPLLFVFLENPLKLVPCPNLDLVILFFFLSLILLQFR